MADDHKKYNIFENILQKINREYVALPSEELNRNNKILNTILDRVVQKIKSKSPLFDNLYRNKYYGGSYYDGLKIGEPSEYDLDCVLSLPKIVEPTIILSDKPGYVHVELKNLEALKKNLVEAPKFTGLEKLLDDGKLSAKKVKSWMEGLMNINEYSKTVDIEGIHCTISQVCKSGPAFTIKVQGDDNGTSFHFNVDFVPCFTFSNQWPGENYRPNPSAKKTTFFVVPKTPSDDHPLHWRLSFPEQEQDLLQSCGNMKPSIKLIKKIRDRHQHSIASYYIKTVFLWERHNMEPSFWQKPLSYVFVTMLKKYSEYLERKNIPYYWNEGNNLIGELPDDTVYCIAQKIKKIVEHIDRMCSSKSDIFKIVPYFLMTKEADLEKFKQDLPVTKKMLKQIEADSSSQEPKSSNSQVHKVSSASSLEDCDPSPPDLYALFSKVETLCLNLASGQQRIFGLLQVAVDKIDKCEEEIRCLKEQLGGTAEAQEECVIENLLDLEVKEEKIVNSDNDNECGTNEDLLQPSVI